MSKISDILKQLRPEVDFNAVTDFFEDGALDSFDLVTLVAELDEAYGISIDGLDITPENFRNEEAITALLTRYDVTP
jgi:acyl carrier protein